MIKAIIFDLNGIFIQSPMLSERVAKDFGVPVSDFLGKLGSIMDKVRQPGAGPSFQYWKPELKAWGIGLSESSAIIVKGDTFEVMGAWKVAVHDNTRLYQPWEKPYFVLSAGDVYNMKTRKIEKYGTGARGRGGDPGGL